MDDANKAVCYAMRNPPKGFKKAPLSMVQKKVKKTDGSRPSLAAISLAAAAYKKEKGDVGRPVGSLKTTKD